MLKANYKIKLTLSKQLITSPEDIVETSYIVYAPSRYSALDGAYQLAFRDYYGYVVLKVQIEPLYN